IDREPDVGADGLTNRPESLDIGTRMPSDFHLDRLPTTAHHLAGPLRRQRWLDGSDHELEADAVRARILTAEQLVPGHAGALAMEIQEGHFEGGLGEAVTDRRLFQAPANPFGVEGIGPEEQRRQAVAYECEGPRLGFAAPDTCHTGFPQAN